jgi:hypothetical protein
MKRKSLARAERSGTGLAQRRGQPVARKLVQAGLERRDFLERNNMSTGKVKTLAKTADVGDGEPANRANELLAQNRQERESVF